MERFRRDARRRRKFWRTAFGIAAATSIAGGWLALAEPVYAAAQDHSPSTSAMSSIVFDPGDPQNDKCKPHRGVGLNPHCPSPVVPEAPLAVLLPLSAAVIFGAGYVVLRRRSHEAPA